MIIGKTITITDAKNKQLIGKNGTVIDETKHTLTINTSKGAKLIIKNNITIEEHT